MTKVAELVLSELKKHNRPLVNSHPNCAYPKADFQNWILCNLLACKCYS